MIFIPVTIGAAALQVARNALQRSLLGDAGPWGATLVRFLFGLPFSLAFVAIAWAVWPDASPHMGLSFWTPAMIGAAAQLGATAALLSAMHHSGFALGTAFQQSSLPFAAIVGLIFLGETLAPLAWLGVAMTTVGVLALSWPKERQRFGVGAILGLVSGAFYGVALNAYRQANLAVEPHHALFAAVVTTSATQAMQSAGLTAWLYIRDRKALVAVLKAWRSSLGAGFFGSAASALWLTALALAPAGQVRAVGVVEMPIAAFAGKRLFAETLNLRQIVLGGLTALGVVLAAVG